MSKNKRTQGSKKTPAQRMSKKHKLLEDYSSVYQKTLAVSAKDQEGQMDEIRKNAKKLSAPKV